MAADLELIERRFKRQKLAIVALKAHIAYLMSELRREGWQDRKLRRVNGEALCECGVSYNDHPDLDPTFHVECSGHIVKT
jgi:hypothetical protein